MKLNLTQKLSMRGFRGPFPHSKMGIFKKNRRSRFWENPFLGTAPTPLKTLFFTNFFTKSLFLNFFARLEIISDVVSEKARKNSRKIPIPHRKYRYHICFFRYHIGNTTMWYRKKPMWYRNFSATCLSDTTSEIISNRVEFIR
jgi:hypothetical protein